MTNDNFTRDIHSYMTPECKVFSVKTRYTILTSSPYTPQETDTDGMETLYD